MINNNRIVIKNMVCPRCIDSVSQIFDDLKINYENVEIGHIKLNQDVSADDLKIIDSKLKSKGFEILEMGGDAVYCSHSIDWIEAMAKEGIPITAHVGLVPNRATWTNYRAVGKTADEALQVYQNVKDLENAGAACVEVEVVPVELADFITKNTKMITMGMGCGDVCDTQYLFCNDILGTNTGHYPRHAKKYIDLKAEEEKLQALREKGFRMFVEDMNNGGYPESKHEIKMDSIEFEKFQEKIK